MGKMWPFLRAQFGTIGYFLGLILISAALLLGFSSLGCSNCGGTPEGNRVTGSVKASKNQAAPMDLSSRIETINPQNEYQPGQRVELKLSGTIRTGYNGQMIWQPPTGATGFQFADLQPEPGGPPFVFTDLNSMDLEGGVHVSYLAPERQEEDHFSDLLKIYHDEAGDLLSLAMSTSNHYYPASPDRIENEKDALLPPLPDQRRPVSASTDTVLVWDILRMTDIESTMTQSVCEQMVEQGQSANLFMPWRIPVADQILPNQSYTLPLVVTNTGSLKMELMSSSTVVTIPMEVRLDATLWANQNLPAATGEVWVALGLDSDAVVNCPVMNSDSYTLTTYMTLNLSSRPQACENCVLPAYGCYRAGTAQSLLLQGMAGLLMDDMSITAVDGFSCLGPSEMQLVDESNWLFNAVSVSTTLKPGDAVMLHYWAWNLDDTASQTFTFAQESTLPGMNWTVHPGKTTNLWEPDLTQTVTSPVSIAPNTFFHFYFTGAVPTNTVEGQYQHAFTLTGATATVQPSSWTGVSNLIVTADGTLPGVAPLDPAVQLSGQVTPGQAEPGQDLTYHLTILNTGAVPLTNLVLTSTVPTSTIYQSCAGGDSCALASGTVTWNLANLGTGQAHSMTLVVEVDPGALLGSVIRHQTYSVQTGQGVSAAGSALEVALGRRLYLPLLLRP
ncbi:MAG TPA: hypothetical protein PKW33_19730 [Anaerolineaceae bacterium]|nr:hypothetical protein [Anaerolineaceae bacterium]HPN53836.1 hypothetical protein [Anaerolineaceae bacterium]